MINGVADYAKSRTQSYIDEQLKQALDKTQRRDNKNHGSAKTKMPDLIKNVKNTNLIIRK